jgi:putative addiction module antidote
VSGAATTISALTGFFLRPLRAKIGCPSQADFGGGIGRPGAVVFPGALLTLLHLWVHCGMVLELKLRKVGNSVGVVLPKEALARLNADEGDAVYLTDSTDGGFRITATNPDFARRMKMAEKLSRRYRHALKELAK